MAAPAVRMLDAHARWRCGHSGACCTAGWPIPVEAVVARRLRENFGDDAPALRLVKRDGLPDGAECLLGVDDAGRCLFFEPERRNLCSIHRRLGADALPAACRHFPRVCLLTPQATTVVLSHFCPTAARLLLASPRPPEIVLDPPGFPRFADYEGLDARGSFPPLLRPGVLMDWDSHARWEEHAVRVLGRHAGSAEDALRRLSRDAETLRRWTPWAGSVASLLRRVTLDEAESAAEGPGISEEDLRRDLEWVEAILRTVPNDLGGLPNAPEDYPTAFRRRVSAAWPAFAPLVGRYLAAKAFGSWISLQGRGLRTAVNGVRAALALLRLQCARLAEAGTRVDIELLLEAVRATDLVLVHLARPDALARALDSEDDDPQDGVARPRPRATASPGASTS